MYDWVLFNSLAFPAFFKVLVIALILWYFLVIWLRRFNLEKVFWHVGFVEVCFLVIIFGACLWTAV